LLGGEDLPPTRRHYRTGRSRFDVYEPGGWNSPLVRKVVNAYWVTMITVIKMLIAIPLTAMLIGSIWLIWTLVTL
jgi:hypothetical protein